MWEWSEAVARRAIAAVWADCRTVEPEPTIVDPEFDEESADYAENEIGAMAAPIDNDVFVLVA